jgi:hypothetical protein
MRVWWQEQEYRELIDHNFGTSYNVDHNITKTEQITPIVQHDNDRRTRAWTDATKK